MAKSKKRLTRPAFGQWLKQTRLVRGYGLRQFAGMIGELPPNLSAMEHGRRAAPSLAKLNKIAELLGVPRDDVCAAALIVPPDIEITLACNPALWPKVRELYSQKGPADAADKTTPTVEQFARELVAKMHIEIKWAAKRRRAATKEADRQFYYGRGTGCTIALDIIYDLAAARGINIEEGGEFTK